VRGVLFFLFVSSGCARARIRSFSARLLNELTKILISLLSFLSFARSRHINEVKKYPYEVKGEKGGGGEGAKCTGLITFDLLLETSGLEVEAQARALGISKNSVNGVWKFFGCRKLGCGMAGAIRAGEHMFDDGIMKNHGYAKGNGVSVFAWYALLDDEKKKLVNNNAAKDRRKNAKYRSTPSGVVNEKGEALMKSKLRYETEKKTPTGVVNKKGKELMKSQLRHHEQYETDKNTPSGVVNEKGKELMKSQLQYEKKKKRNEAYIRSQVIHGPPLRMKADRCSTCPRKSSFGWTVAKDALYLVETLFEKENLEEYPSRKVANAYLTKKKRRHVKDENVSLRSTDILCYGCWTKCRRAAEARIEELLQAQKKI